MTAQREVSVQIVKPFAMPSNSAHDGCTERGTDKGNLSHAFMRAKSIIAYPIQHKHPEMLGTPLLYLRKKALSR